MRNILFEDVTVERNHRIVLDSINLSVRAGESIGIFGPNGAGKTTLLNLVNGLINYKSGKVLVGNVIVSPASARKIQLIAGYVPQNFELDPKIPILTGTVVLSGCYGKLGLFHYPDSLLIEKAREIMNQFEIPHLFLRPFGQISEGERQKAMIARSLMQEPEILLLDEPFSSISERSKETITEIIKKWQKEKGFTMLLVSHERPVIEKLCDRVIYLEEGKIVSQEKIYGNL
ncbi:MAG: ATP-binding cassette domain-containing protein [Candidatus Omnitrophica bacterium]|nr:ATP-binding cassette domain-containing protein [Candidatus Omnitrophota bacterium]